MLSDQGTNVIITGRSEERLKLTSAKLGVDGVLADVSQPKDWEYVKGFICNTYGTLDVLINNAETGVVIKELAEQSLEEINECIKINLMGSIYGIHCFVPMMKEHQRRTIINLSSVCAEHAWERYSIYAAAKAGVLNLSKSAYAELQKNHIRVTCVIPGAGETNFQVHAQDRPLDPSPDNLKPEDLAKAICDICALPEHVVVERVTVWGISQIFRPF